MLRLCIVVTLVLTGCSRSSGHRDDAPAAASRSGDAGVDARVDAGRCAREPCDILPRCGCAGVRACDVDTSDGRGTACRSILEPGRESATCSALDRCDKGYVCLGSATAASCKRYCSGAADCSAPRGRCAIDIASGGTPVAEVPPACSSNCDPLAASQPAECPTGFKCGLFTATHGGAGVNVADCTPAGSGTQGASCGTISGKEALCAPGYLCTSLGSGFQCRRICNRTANTGCTGAQACLGFTMPHTIDIEYGVCD